MEDISFCPYRTVVTYDPSIVQTAQFEVSESKWEDPKTFTGTASDLELLDACNTERPPRLPYQLGRKFTFNVLIHI